MRLLDWAVIFSGVSFLGYAITYFTSEHIKREFERFKLPNLGRTVALFQILGAVGLLASFRIPATLPLASGGLSLMMLIAILVRLRVNDSLWVSLPAIFYFGLNLYIVIASVSPVKV